MYRYRNTGPFRPSIRFRTARQWRATDLGHATTSPPPQYLAAAADFEPGPVFANLFNGLDDEGKVVDPAIFPHVHKDIAGSCPDTSPAWSRAAARRTACVGAWAASHART